MTLQEKLDDAEAVYHEWMTGRTARTYVDQNGERVEYSLAGVQRLASYIASLKSQLNTTGRTGPFTGFM